MINGLTGLFKSMQALQRFNFLNIVVQIEIKYQGTPAEETILQQLNQGTCTDVLYYHPCLNFLWLLSLHQGKESDRNRIKNQKIQ